MNTYNPESVRVLNTVRKTIYTINGASVFIFFGMMTVFGTCATSELFEFCSETTKENWTIFMFSAAGACFINICICIFTFICMTNEVVLTPKA